MKCKVCNKRKNILFGFARNHVCLECKRKKEEINAKEVYSNCYTCGKNLVDGQEITTVHQYHYCDDNCLNKDKSKIKLGVIEN